MRKEIIIGLCILLIVLSGCGMPPTGVNDKDKDVDLSGTEFIVETSDGYQVWELVSDVNLTEEELSYNDKINSYNSIIAEMNTVCSKIVIEKYYDDCIKDYEYSLKFLEKEIFDVEEKIDKLK